MERKTYLEDVPLEEALSRYFAAISNSGVGQVDSEMVRVEDSARRITAEPIWARVSSPHYHAAAMDGIAVDSKETVGASRTQPKKLGLGVQAFWVDTGNAMPLGTNAVIMVEDIQVVGQEAEIQAAVAPWHNVRPLGEDIVASEMVLPEGHEIRPHDLGALVGSGLLEILVRRRPKVAVIPTGSEVVPPGSPLEAGKIVEYNALMIGEQVKEWGGEAWRFPIIPDDKPRLVAAVSEAVRSSDLVIINAGSSAGSHDFTAPVVEELGHLIIHGIAIRPGHPTILGIVGGKPVIGIPGYPVSALITSELVVKPVIGKLLGISIASGQMIAATVTRKISAPIGQDEFVRVSLGKIGDRIVATPLSRGAGVITSLVRADGLMKVPRLSQGLDAGSTVKVELRRPIAEVENTIVSIGSHDLSLDILNSLMHKHYPGRRVSSAHVGSLGGLIALKRGEAHIAGTHLLDESSGQYNIAYINQVLPGKKTVLMNLAFRQQGLMVSKGNPMQVTGLKDLTRPEVGFANRQPGSGTRVLLDYKLKQAGIDPGKINGYAREEYSHTGVAALISSGSADVGLGILAAARALGLDFLPLLQEEYDLAIPSEFFESELLNPLLRIIRGDEFRQILESLGGYDTRDTGRVIATVE